MKKKSSKIRLLLIVVIVLISTVAIYLMNIERNDTNVIGNAKATAKDTEETLEDIVELIVSAPETAVQGEVINVAIKAKGLNNSGKIIGLQGELKASYLEIQSCSLKKENWILNYDNTTGVFLAELEDLSDSTSFINTEEEVLLVLKCKVNLNTNTGEQTINLTNAVAAELESNELTGLVKITSDTINITERIGVDSVSLNKTELSIEPNQTETLVATVLPDNATNKEVEWSSNNENVATVDNNGVVTTKNLGEAVITVKSLEDETKTATCIVNVIDTEKPKITNVEVTTTKDTLAVEVTATDNIAISEYNIKLYKYGGDSLITEITNRQTNSARFSGLEPNTKYEVVIIVKDTAGNTSTEVAKAEYTKPNSPTLRYNGVELSTEENTPTIINANLDTYTIDVTEGDKNYYSLDNGESWNEVLENKINFTVENNELIHVKVKAIGNQSEYVSEEKDYYLKFSVLITNIEITSNIETNEIDLVNSDKTLTLTATITPENASDQELEWTSSNENVATVAANGKTAVVTGLIVGNTTITVKTKDGSRIEKEINIIVKDSTPIVKPVTSIEITGSKNTIDLDSEEKSIQLIPIVLPEDADNRTVAWTSSNTEIATVDSTGLVTAKKKGTVTITAMATDGTGIQDTYDITITSNIVLVEEIEIISDTNEIDLNEDKTLQLSVKINPENATNQEVSWTTSDDTIATVNAKGLVTAKKEGTVTITATAKDSSGKSATYTITVVDNKKEVVVEGDKDEDKEQEEKEDIQATIKDPTSATTKLPDTGKKGIIVLIVISIISIICFIRYRSYKDVK